VGLKIMIMKFVITNNMKIESLVKVMNMLHVNNVYNYYLDVERNQIIQKIKSTDKITVSLTYDSMIIEKGKEFIDESDKHIKIVDKLIELI